MSYHLLTGATGLLGSYLLHDAARRDLPLAVVVRRTRIASARQRIEDIYSRWEKQRGTLLVRPVLLEGSLSQPQLGLSPQQVAWVREHCTAAIHNAASLTFVAENSEAEPYASNVAGTRNVLDLCDAAGIRHFHHVSTAYVCGLRTGRVLESELDVGQEMGNDYERSKLMAEKMVRACGLFDSLTVFRPGIITGDSKNGYTSTFHGFYVPLKAAHGLLREIAGSEPFDMAALLTAFGVRPQDRKNFVPVDWVSAFMLHVIGNRAWHGRTYHLTPASAAPVGDMAEVMQEVLTRQWQVAQPTRPPSEDEHFQAVLLQQMEVYRSYWRDDPEFDRTNTCAAAPHLPCPTVDKSLLRLACEYAVRSNFGWPKPPQQIPELDVEAMVAKIPLTPDAPSGALGVVVSGPGGGAWQLGFQSESLCSIAPGVHSSTNEIVYLSTPTLAALLRGGLTTSQAMKSGQLLCLQPSADTDNAWLAKFDKWIAGMTGEIASGNPTRFEVPLTNA